MAHHRQQFYYPGEEGPGMVWQAFQGGNRSAVIWIIRLYHRTLGPQQPNTVQAYLMQRRPLALRPLTTRPVTFVLTTFSRNVQHSTFSAVTEDWEVIPALPQLLTTKLTIP